MLGVKENFEQKSSSLLKRSSPADNGRWEQWLLNKWNYFFQLFENIRTENAKRFLGISWL